MTLLSRPQRAIDGKGRTIRELLAGHKYSIDYYQREYKWHQKQVAELVDKLLADKFLESHEEGNERSAVAEYGHYFLGSIIISDKDGQKFIIDGQREHYVGQNLLARSLHERAYDHNPGFIRFIESSGLAFRTHAQFKKADLDARQALYRSLAEQIWSTDRLKQEA